MAKQCPGQDTRFWRPEDIFDVTCPCCGVAVEFLKDDVHRDCGCGCRLLNPKLDLGCVSHCKCAGDCVPELAPTATPTESGSEPDEK